MEHGQRVASYDASLVVSGGVDCRRRRRNVYDKKPRRYAKDNRTAHLTARNDKSVAYRPHSIILAICKPGCKPGLQPGFRQVRASLQHAFDFFVENLVANLLHQFRHVEIDAAGS